MKSVSTACNLFKIKVTAVVKNRKYIYEAAALENLNAETGNRLLEKSIKNLDRAKKRACMNCGIHAGAVPGFRGKPIVFIPGIVAAGLPLSGFIVWDKKVRIRVKNSWLKIHIPRYNLNAYSILIQCKFNFN